MKRKLPATLAISLVALALLRLAALQGLLLPLRIAGPSMANALVGRHLELVCEDCRFPFRCDAERLPVTALAVCPNCGYSRNRLLREQRGQRVLVDRFAFCVHQPQRWDLVALRRVDRELSVKRVVGLPGECISIRHGDIYVNGHLLRKSLTEFRRLATLVHDDTYRPSRSTHLPRRWRSELTSGDWQPTPRGFRFAASTTAATASRGGSKDWLMYHHWRCYAGPFARTEEIPISDNCSYNQAESRTLRDVTDVLLSCDVTLGPHTSLEVRIHDGHGFVSAQIDLANQSVAVWRDGQLMEMSQPLPIPPGRSWQLEFGTFDRQVIVAMDGQVVVNHACGEPSGRKQACSAPIGIAVTSGCAELENLRGFRDIYYLDPRNLGIDWNQADRLEPDELFVLGDNTAISDDSRSWPRSEWNRKTLIGRILAWPW